MLRKTARKVLELEAAAIAALLDRLDESFDEAVELLFSCQGRVVTTGMGKSGIICRKVAATLASTGTPAIFLHPAEAIHGDLGMLAKGDVVLMLSNSGTTAELVQLLEAIRRLDIRLIVMSGASDSVIAKNADVSLDVSVSREACPLGLAPTASTTCALALGDALAMALAEKKGFRMEDFARLHPGGKLGKKLATVADLMHRGEEVPRVTPETRMDAVIYEMSRKRLGVTAVVDAAGKASGIISDGDLRRLLEKHRGDLLEKAAGDCMTSSPITIAPETLAVEALNLMEEKKITSLLVVDAAATLCGLIHLHDLWKTELF